MKYTADELGQMPTLVTGHTDDPKMETDTTRVWLARTTTEDGEPYNHKVTVEKLQEGHWMTTEEYPG
jgi:hypothetical protein